MLKLSLFLSVLFLGSAFKEFIPQKTTWRQLATTSFTEYYDNSKSIWSLEAQFPEAVLDLQGKEVYITGYVLPIDTKGELYALSAYPFSSCFFCGGAGPETVMGLEFASQPGRLATDAVKTYSGRLVLSSKPNSGFYFTLTNVKPYSP